MASLAVRSGETLKVELRVSPKQAKRVKRFDLPKSAELTMHCIQSKPIQCEQ